MTSSKCWFHDVGLGSICDCAAAMAGEGFYGALLAWEALSEATERVGGKLHLTTEILVSHVC